MQRPPSRRAPQANAACAALLYLALAVAAPAQGVTAYGPGGPGFEKTRPAHGEAVVVQGEHGAVAADHALASEAGVAVLREGGNALDAAIAAAFVLGVISPSGSGLGGGGFIVYWSRRDRKAFALDFRERAPRALRAAMFVVHGKPDTRLSQRGGLAAGVPGEVAGLYAAHRRFGQLPWHRLPRAAIELARDGFIVDRHLAEDLAYVGGELVATPHLASLYAPHGRPLEAGSRLVNPGLAATLDAIARRGRDAFYRGAVARAIVRADRAAGGVMTEEDLAAYEPTWRKPVHGRHRGFEVYSMPPPSSGGAVLLEVLNILEALPIDWRRPDSAPALHALAEAEKHAFSDRAVWFGDPDYVKVPLAALVSEAHARRIAALIRPGKTAPAAEYVHQLPRDSGTTHISAIDAAGNACALTSTINTEFGSLVLVPGTGIVLNDEMDDFSIGAGVANAFGLVGGAANAPAPGKRPLSSMSPTLVVRDAKPVMVAGASGGPRIITGTLRVLTEVLDAGLDVGAAVSAPRVHHQWSPDVLRAEAGFAPSTLAELARFGHKVSLESPGSAVQAVTSRSGHLRAASDPRKGGVAAAY